mmetsp:Transcript_70223/g.135555  ORF Transcript_70223/g.135555 Transcript_70223/m.135555 type:complete len:200 (-) Transcript_70223:935-1534(-)
MQVAACPFAFPPYLPSTSAPQRQCTNDDAVDAKYKSSSCLKGMCLFKCHVFSASICTKEVLLPSSPGALLVTRRILFEMPHLQFASMWARQVFWPSSPEASSLTVASSGGRRHQNRTRWSLSALTAKSRGMLPAGSDCVGSAPAAARASATARLFLCTDPRSRRDHPSNFSACSSNENAVEKGSGSCGGDLLPRRCGGP